jgi:TctA family transporter
MELFTVGFPAAFSVENLFYCFVGVFLGTFVGVLPGIGSIATIALLLPITFHMAPTAALVMLAGVYYGSEYGGSITSILLNLPGSASSAITSLDGNPMSKQGRAGVALFVTTMSSFTGGVIGILLLMFLTPFIVSMTLAFGSAEYFAAMLFGLIAAATIGKGNPLRGVAMVILGLLLGTIGTDINTGISRYSFGFYELADGISISIIAMGLFGVSEIIDSIRGPSLGIIKQKITMRSMIPTKDDVRRSILPTLRGSGLGSFFGPLPGTGPTIASFLGYALEKKLARDPSRFGKGAIEGVASPEAANNAAAQTSFIPTLTLGIPGSATMAMIIGAMMIHGISPGPKLMMEHSEVFWGLIASFWIGNVMLLVLNIPLIGIWVKMLQIPANYLHPAIICFIFVGAYSINGSVFDVVLVLLLGIVGYGMRLVDLEPAPLLIGFILGPMLEENFRRAMLLARGDFLVILQRPISGTMLAMTVVLLLWFVVAAVRKTRSPAIVPPAD